MCEGDIKNIDRGRSDKDHDIIEHNKTNTRRQLQEPTAGNIVN